MSDVNFDDYAEFEQEAARDDRIGDHTLMVVNKATKTWPGGDEYLKVDCQIQTAGNAKVSVDFSKLMSPEQIKAESATWEAKKKKGVAATIALYKALAQEYGKKPSDLDIGDEFRAKIVKNKDGYLRVAAILPKMEPEF